MSQQLANFSLNENTRGSVKRSFQEIENIQITRPKRTRKDYSFINQAESTLHSTLNFLNISDVFNTITAVLSGKIYSDERDGVIQRELAKISLNYTHVGNRDVVKEFRNELSKITFQEHHIWNMETLLHFSVLKDRGRINVPTISNITCLKYLQELFERVIPSRVKFVTFSYLFNELLTFESLSEMTSLRILDFGCSYNQTFNANTLPKSLRVLKLGDGFNQPLLENALPENLEELHFGRSYIRPLKIGVLPTSLKILKMKSLFNQPLGMRISEATDVYSRSMRGSENFDSFLPGGLVELHLGYCFNQPLGFVETLRSGFVETLRSGFAETLRSGFVETLRSGIRSDNNSRETPNTQSYRKYISFLPKSLRILRFEGDFNRSLNLNRSLQNLSELDLGERFNKILNLNDLPRSLVVLKFGRDFDQPLYGNVLPEGLRELYFGYSFNKFLHDKNSLSILPKSLKVLKFHRMFNRPLGNFMGTFLPKNLEELALGYKFNQALGISSSKYSFLPESLKILDLGYEFNQSLDTHISDAPSIGALGQNLQNISEKNKRVPAFKSFLPTNLEILNFSYLFNQPLMGGTLPKSLKVLKMGDSFNHSLGLAETLRSGFCETLRSGFCETTQIGASEGTRSDFTEFVQNNKTARNDSSSNAGKCTLLLPDGLEELELSYKFNQPLGLAETLRSGAQNNNSKEIAQIGFLQSVRHGRDFDTSEKSAQNGDVPIGKTYNIISFLPKSLKILRLGAEFNQPLGVAFNQVLEKGSSFLPENLEELDLTNSNFNRSLSAQFLPKSLKILRLKNTQLPLLSGSFSQNLRIFVLDNGSYVNVPKIQRKPSTF